MQMVFTTEQFLKVAVESWSESYLNLRPLNSVQTLKPTELSGHYIIIVCLYRYMYMYTSIYIHTCNTCMHYIYTLYTLYIHACFISINFISNVRLKLAKNQTKSKEHPEAELLLFENYLLSLSTLSSKNKWRYSQKCMKDTEGCINEVI